ncbi:MAG: aldehyde dehydrogenase [Nonlabens sp.]
MNVENTYQSQKDFFKSGKTKSVDFRVKSLKKLQHVLKQNEEAVYKVLKEDLGKSQFESFLTEYYVIANELKKYIKNTKKWSKPDRVTPSILNFPSTAKIYKEPYGTTLVIAPWNYPFQLALGPLIGAVAGGNTVVLKPSEFSTATSQLLEDLITLAFDPNHVKVIQGDAEVSKKLTSLAWDYLFFTGSPKVGNMIYKAAAEHMTPVTLELGGKNPCVIHESANIKVAAKRIVWGKFLNAGQTCIAPDYLICHESLKDKMLEALKSEIINFYGEQPERNPDYPRIIRRDHLESLIELLDEQYIYYGGGHDVNDLYLAPTLMDQPPADSKVMEGEIFGPIVPLVTYKTIEDIEEWIGRYAKPLGGYCFTEDKEFSAWFIHKFPFGGGVINDSIVQFVNERLPFGGVGNSGIGAYHGKKTFEVFSHHKSMVHRRTWLDIKVKYPPYKGKLKKIKKLLKFV